MEELIGQTLGPYQIIEQIGEGGMATVFRAYQASLDRYVAVKVLPPVYAKKAGFSERFEREAKAVARLNHPNILPVYEAGQANGYSFIGMRYVENAHSLKELMAHPLTLTQIADLIGQIGSALSYAHQHGVLHRDVKPANVLMDGNWALLSDFGLAKMTEESVQLTGTGVGMGTPSYMSPEQGQGQNVDHRTDIYSLGIVLFEMLTNQVPHRAETPIATIVKRATEPLPLPHKINPNIPESVERVVLKALARNPDDRFDSADQMAEALHQAVQAAPNPHLLMTSPDDEHTLISDSDRAGTQPAPPVEATAASVPAARLGRPRWLLVVGAIVLLVLIVGGFIFSRGSGQQQLASEGQAQAALPAETATATQIILTPTQTATTVPSNTPSPTATTTPSPEPTFTATNTTTPTHTPSPTQTNTPLPTNTPEPTVPPTPQTKFVHVGNRYVRECQPNTVPSGPIVLWVGIAGAPSAGQTAEFIGDSFPVFTVDDQPVPPASQGFGGMPLDEHGRALEPNFHGDEYGWGLEAFAQTSLEPGIYELFVVWDPPNGYSEYFCTLTVTE